MIAVQTVAHLFEGQIIGVKSLSGFLIIKAFFFVNLVSKHASKMNVQEFAS